VTELTFRTYVSPKWEAGLRKGALTLQRGGSWRQIRLIDGDSDLVAVQLTLKNVACHPAAKDCRIRDFKAADTLGDLADALVAKKKEALLVIV